jgi:hypothetical protein
MQSPSSDIERVDQPDIDEVALTTRASVSPLLEAVAHGVQNGTEDLRDQPVIVPSIDITESQEPLEVLPTYEGTEAEQTDDVVPQPLSLADEGVPKVSAEYYMITCV